MPDINNLLPALPPILATNLIAQTSPATPLAECRLMGWNDPTYGGVNWIPRDDGKPFAIVYTESFEDDAYKEPQRLWDTTQVMVFIAIDRKKAPGLAQDYQGLANAFIAAARQVIPANRRLLPYSLTLSNIPGDVWWEHKKGKIEDNHLIKGVGYYGVLLETYIHAVIPVSYQQ